MVITLSWIVGSLLVAGAVAAIITYWNELVDWANEILEDLYDATVKLVRKGEQLCMKIYSVVKGWFTSKIVTASAEDMYELYKQGKIDLDTLGDTLTNREIERLHNNGVMSDSEYNYLIRSSGR